MSRMRLSVVAEADGLSDRKTIVLSTRDAEYTLTRTELSDLLTQGIDVLRQTAAGADEAQASNEFSKGVTR